MLMQADGGGKYAEQAKTYIGVRFEHLGRTVTGMDCAGLVTRAAEDIGYAVGSTSVGGYGRMPEDGMFLTSLRKYFTELPYNRLQPLHSQIVPGDVLSFWVDVPNRPRHLGIFTGTDSYGMCCMVHSHAKLERGVMEAPIDASFWLPRITGLWRLHELVKGV
ncbi:dipeptide cell wall hydrolase [Rhodobacter phage RcDurkin]|nr:dipeptide cell wall hydrolase [Rhodobacter phage RcDurkin]QXN72518.1 dipeptide cell wall hydrolase [Rhodobacter phage RcTiptonus]UUV43792.1 dipeptide cell wall hydrolase [Rhodobacter phage RcKickapoo]UUV44419.1 dipeptide cell wall hydrolase [Rhodobacter phage RcMenchie]